MKEPKYNHRGIVTNSKMIFDLPEMFNAKRTSLEGKRFSMILEEEFEPPTNPQRGYYFGAIIGLECINSSDFAGWTKDEIHNYLVEKITGYNKSVKIRGKEQIVRCIDQISEYSKRRMNDYIEKVMLLLSTEHGIVVKDSSEYALQKYKGFDKLGLDDKN
jgi:hypothetical protein